MKTTSVVLKDADRQWHLVDLENVTVGQAATVIASVLRGKHRPTFTPNADNGDYVVVVNAEKVVLTGTKWQKKMYYRHSNYPGGLTETRADKMLERHPERIIEAAVRGMLPKNSLGRRMLKKLKIHVGPEHPHVAQQPQPLSLR